MVVMACGRRVEDAQKVVGGVFAVILLIAIGFAFKSNPKLTSIVLAIAVAMVWDDLA